jgi:hypothetical protein
MSVFPQIPAGSRGDVSGLSRPEVLFPGNVYDSPEKDNGARRGISNKNLLESTISLDFHPDRRAICQSSVK